MNKVFTVIGIGEVGSMIAALINTSFSGIKLHLIDIYPEKNGKILDLQHAGASNDNDIQYNASNALSESDYIIFAAGYSNIHGESRNSVGAKNKELVRSLFSSVQLKPEVVIVVITNPVEPVSHWINEITGVRATVIGTGTALDTFRLKFLIQKRFNCTYDKINTLVVGEHGLNMVPLFSSTLVNGIPITDLVNANELVEIENELKQSAFKIRETEKATKFGVAETTLFILKALLGQHERIIPVSMPFEDDLHKNLYVSLPAVLRNGTIHRIHFTMDVCEKEKFQAAIGSIAGNLE